MSIAGWAMLMQTHSRFRASLGYIVIQAALYSRIHSRSKSKRNKPLKKSIALKKRKPALRTKNTLLRCLDPF